MSQFHKVLAPWPRYTRWVWLLCALLAAGAIVVAVDAYRLGAQAAADQEHLAQLHKLAKPKVQPKLSRSELEEQKRWASLRAEKAFDWYPVFVALERSSEADIELLEFEPDKAGRRIVLRGEARNTEALRDYLERLSVQNAFAEVYLAHEKTKLRDGFVTLSFEIRARISTP
ncbi:hypothetical protein GTP45_12725 [Pseudoduganella sp. FT55W]|uniref:PilN domain-containing protein n=1 Tax=Duganella rivi TaxID=2666083 RepID=A0A7X4GQC0_9BURK|nr:hypothetical protein [Duganella rivi]MYM67693.1 hypothetical protein [Duganella rivi]